MNPTIKKELDSETMNTHNEVVHCVVIKDDQFVMNRSGDRIELEGCNK